MANSINIYPFQDTEGFVRFSAQIIIFIVGLIIAYKMIIKPAMRLINERKKRTEGNTDLAKRSQEHLSKMEIDYHQKLKEGTDIAREFRAKEIIIAQKSASDLLAQNQKKAQELVHKIQGELNAEMQTARAELSQRVHDIVLLISSKVGLVLVAGFFITALFYSNFSFASENKLIESVWYSIFWPYFQFIVFLAAIIYWGRKPIKNLLEKRRDEFKVQLADAREAVSVADRKIQAYEIKLAALKNEIAKIKEQNLEDAKIETEKILAEAVKTSEVILRDAERVSREMIMRGYEDLKHELMHIALVEFDKQLTPQNLEKIDNKLKQETVDAIRSTH